MCRQRSYIPIAVLCLLSTVRPADNTAKAGESSAPTGTLRIEGTGVQRLQLFDGGGKRHSVEVIDGLAELGPSTYTVYQVYLTNGLYSQVSETVKVEVTADAEAILKVGGPLKQRIEAKRQGCMLVFSSFTEGMGGIRYSGRPAGGAPPTFEVYKGDRKIHDGKFEYG